MVPPWMVVCSYSVVMPQSAAADVSCISGQSTELLDCRNCASLCFVCVVQLSLRGSADAAEGVSLDELKLVVGQAQLSAKGLLGGKQQDAAFSLTDFPAVLLQPLFSALPALQVGTSSDGVCTYVWCGWAGRGSGCGCGWLVASRRTQLSALQASMRFCCRPSLVHCQHHR